MKHSGGIRHFVRANMFALGVAAAWLVVVWGLVLAGQAWFSHPLPLSAWAGDWDGGWYRSIVEHGYYSGPLDRQANVAFFPLLPALTWLVSKVTLLPTVWAGLFVSSVSFATALVVLWHFVGKFFTHKRAKWTLLLLAFNPFSLYFGMFYTESLFLLLAVSAFWFIYEKQWWWAAFFAGLATATRSVGIAVAAAVVIGWILERFRKPPVKPGWRTLGTPLKKAKVSRVSWVSWVTQTIFLAVLSCSGALAFAGYLWWHASDPFAFMTVQQFWPGREAGMNIGNELAYLWAHKDINMEYLLTAMWYACAVFAAVGVVILLRMRQWLMALYTAIAVALPLVFGTATAMNRYMLVAFPIFIAYAAVITKLPLWLRVAILVVSIGGLVLTTYLMLDPRHLFIG
jgi:hypothetical protein